jgi:Leucine carboxyl methyltransferase
MIPLRFTLSAKSMLRRYKPIHVNLKIIRYRLTYERLWRHGADMSRTNSLSAFDVAFANMSYWEQGLTRSPTETLFRQGVLHVFEVNHPRTQTWKRARLEDVGITLPGDLTFAPVDFETQTLAEGLLDAGYDSGKWNANGVKA